MGRMTNRNQSVTRPALNAREDSRCVIGSCMVEEGFAHCPFPVAASFVMEMPAAKGVRLSTDVSPCRPVEEIGRAADWHPNPLPYRIVNQGTRLAHRENGRDSLRLMWPCGGGGAVVVSGRESRPHGEGLQFGTRSCGITKHDMRNHHA
jgi:hypothetical protein